MVLVLTNRRHVVAISYRMEYVCFLGAVFDKNLRCHQLQKFLYPIGYKPDVNK